MVIIRIPLQYGKRMLQVLTEAHRVVRALGDGEDVRRHLVPPLQPVDADRALSVDGEALVRVHGNTEKARVSLK